MTTIDIFTETYNALSANKVRSGLTMLGIIIGISSVIAMVAIGQGAQSNIQSNIQSLGANLIQVFPGAQRNIGFSASSGRGTSRTLILDDAEAVSSISSVRAVAPEASGRFQVTAKGANTNTSVIGITPTYEWVRNVSVAEGSFISDVHARSAAKVAVIGPTTRDDLFGEGVNPIGQSIRINGLEFKVIGVTVVKGGTGFTNRDDVIYIPLKSAQRYLLGGSYVTTINIQVDSPDNMKIVSEEVTAILLARHRITDSTQADFMILNQEDIINTASSVTETFTILLAAVASISLLVGGIGIMNMMLTTVTERTREIGLRKAIGARRRDIAIQFLAEATTLTFVGGLAGVILGFLVSWGMTYFNILQTSVTMGSILLAFSVSAGIGIVFGYYPARRASKLSPIDALRYE